MKPHRRWIVLASWLQGVSALAFAQPQQSENFRITKSVLDAGGGVSASESFRLTSAFGQPSPLGQATSADFRLIGGFLSPAAQLSPLSPVQALVVQLQTQDIFLSWQPVAGAGRYRIYRGSTPEFTLAPGNQLGTTSDTSFTDSGTITQPITRQYYIVTADTAPAVPLVSPPAATRSGDHPR